MEVTEAIDQKVGEVRTDSIDMSIGEIISLFRNKELIIQPDFQRLFRWSLPQRSRLIESVLLQLPLPSIFVIEREDGRFELIDGLQRVSSLIQFVEGTIGEEGNLILEGCDLVAELNGQTFNSLPLTIRLKLKRTAIRTVIIKRQSSQFLRYEMFKRLNTGGTKLSDQDIRNVNARMFGDSGTKFYEFITRCAKYPQFKTTIELMSQASLDARGDEEIVLRYFAAKNYTDSFKGSIDDWLDDYMERILLGKMEFIEAEEWITFTNLFDTLANHFGCYAFVKYKQGQPIGGVAPAYYEAVTVGSLSELEKLKSYTSTKATEILSKTVESEAFRSVTGPGANSLTKLKARIELVSKAIASGI